MNGKLIVSIMPDGSIRTDARGMAGTEREIMAELESLSRHTGGGGAVEVEKHEHGRHAHTTTADHVHTGTGGHRH